MAAATLGISDPALAVLAAGSLPVAKSAIKGALERLGNRVGAVIGVGADVRGCTPEHLVDDLTATDAKSGLLSTCIGVAAVTTWEPKIRVLGRALADGSLLEDDARVQEEILWLRILGDLEAPHLRVVSYLLQPDPERSGHMMFARREKLQEVSGFDELIGPELQRLERHALVRTYVGGNLDEQTIARWSLSDGTVVYSRGELSQRCLDRFAAAGSDASATYPGSTEVE